MRKFIEINGRLMPVDSFTEINGQQVPVIKATAEEKLYPDGRKDCIIHVPCLTINSKSLKLDKEE